VLIQQSPEQPIPSAQLRALDASLEASKLLAQSEIFEGEAGATLAEGADDREQHVGDSHRLIPGLRLRAACGEEYRGSLSSTACATWGADGRSLMV
jgi:hypothetical protein